MDNAQNAPVWYRVANPHHYGLPGLQKRFFYKRIHFRQNTFKATPPVAPQKKALRQRNALQKHGDSLGGLVLQLHKPIFLVLTHSCRR